MPSSFVSLSAPSPDVPNFFNVEGRDNEPFKELQPVKAPLRISSTPSGIINDPERLLQPVKALSQITLSLSGNTKVTRLRSPPPPGLLKAETGMLSAECFSPGLLGFIHYALIHSYIIQKCFSPGLLGFIHSKIRTSLRLTADNLFMLSLIKKKSLALISPLIFRFFSFV